MNRLRQATALLLGTVLMAACQAGPATAPTDGLEAGTPDLMVIGTTDDLDDALTRILPVLAATPGATGLTKHLEAARDAAARGQAVRLREQLGLALHALDAMEDDTAPAVAADVDALRLMLDARF
ncbi:hypothetical protein [Gemmatimonas phototrophica]|uniref:Uncharacterized protein n=1 Tax=Gemmatimonas phototrophica TaxID=1379270 RepID=A0A143BFR3_9BACT|nr:hypothetical protein [Gemmatimonas phototrophica]AMW03847.1 hypothetical protein GEMMAAP_01295 [Gemmatimonas phototrophica]